MAINLPFGIVIQRQQPEVQTIPGLAFAPPENDDGAMVVAAGGAYGTYVDIDGAIRNEAELINKYRDMSIQAECDMAIDDIVNEVIVKEEESPIVDIDLSDMDEIVGEQVTEVIREEWEHIKDLLGVERHGYDLFRRWYIDGKIVYHAITDPNEPDEGILELRYLDPRKIRKVREIDQQRSPNQPNLQSPVTTKEYYVYSERAYTNAVSYSFNVNNTQIAKDSIINITSGLTDKNATMVYSYLHKAIKPLNQLRMLEDASVIYRIARAPERRVFKIAVGNLPKMKAEQYVNSIMTKYKNRLIYDASTGQIRDDRKFMTMTEDFWIPTRGNGDGTDIDTLPGGQNLGEMTDVEYFKEKLYRALGVPLTRLQSDNLFNVGFSSEISRDELKFQKFVLRLRHRFCELFYEALGKQLVLKKVMTIEEWEAYRKHVTFKFANDNNFAELKRVELLKARLGLLAQMQPFIGIFFSIPWVYKNVLNFTDEEIEDMEKENAQTPQLPWNKPPPD